MTMKAILLLLLIGFALPTKADFYAALDAYESEDFEKAYEKFFDMASIGEKRSQFNLGVMYFQGQHVKKDINKAYAWLKLSTDSEIMNTNHVKAFHQVKDAIKDKTIAEQEYDMISAQFSTDKLIDKLYPEIVTMKQSTPFNATPLKIVEPKYPTRAAMKGQQGWAQFTFDLDKKGIPRNIQLIESIPAGVFDKDSLRAIEKWQFTPAKNKKGEAIIQENMKYTMRFQLKGAGPMELKKGVYEKNLKLAQGGDPNAQFKVGFFEKKLDVSKGKENPNEWFLKAAIQGHPSAQFQIGQSLIYGQGCRLDKNKGIDWLTRAANNGARMARLLLASTASKVPTLESQKQSLRYTEGLEQLSPKVIIDQAWMLITSPYKEVSNPKMAIDLLSDITSYNFKDDITIYEIKAAAYAALGDFEEAVDLQEEALDEAQHRKADTDLISTRLASYKRNEKWF